MRYIFYYYNEFGTLTLDFWGDNDRKTYSYVFTRSSKPSENSEKTTVYLTNT